MSFGHALYYPHINLTNKNWLKHAFLYWDKISRIVPTSVEAADSEDIIQLRSETDFIEDYKPEKWDVSSAAQQFFHWFARYADHPDFHDYYEHRFGIPWHHRREFNRYHRRNRGINHLLNTAAMAGGTYLHVQKLDRDLKDFLIATGIAIPGENEWEDWVRIDSEIGLLYMSYLARSISEKTSRPVITDEVSLFAGSEVMAGSIARARKDELKQHIGTLLIATFGPANMNSVTFKQLIEFRRKHDNQRQSFFDHVDKLCSAMPQIDSEEAFKDAMNHHLKALHADVIDMKKQLTDMRIDPVIRFIGVSVPTACASLTEYVPAASKGIVVAAGIMLGMATAFHEWKKDNSEKAEEPLSYLATMDKDLSADGFISKIRDAFQRAHR